MKKLLRFEIKQNLRKPSRVYIKSIDLKTIYGSFQMDAPEDFDGWNKLSTEETIELKQFIQNIRAVNKYLQPSASSALSDFRFRLPVDFIETLEQLEIICHDEGIELDIFDGIMTSIIHQMRIAVAKLESTPKMNALALLDKANITDFKKQTHTEQIQAVFSEIQAIYNRSEKLHQKALILFNKDKSYSPLAIKGMAIGETLPSKWLVSCAVDLLMDENIERVSSLLTVNDLYILWAKPLKESTYHQNNLINKAKKLKLPELVKMIEMLYSR